MSADNRASGEAIQQQVEEIITAGALGKSDAYVRLLRFLADRAHTNKSVKEIEIAIEVFGRDETFDVTQDSLVRVYIHKLRTKLDQFYINTDKTYQRRLSIPKGSYLLGLETNENPAAAEPVFSRFANRERLLLISVSLVIGVCITLFASYLKDQEQFTENPMQSAIWSPLGESDKPLLVVLGDVFIFSEVTSEFEQLREIRDFSIGNNQDFLRRQESDSAFLESYRDFGVRYLPEAIGPSIKSLGRFLGADQAWQIRLSSQLADLDIEQFNIIYIGYFSSLNQFEQKVFNNSVLQLHPNGNVLIQGDTGEVYVGDGQRAEGYRDRYLDYAMLRKTEIADGSYLFALMSARDAGLENLAEFVFSAEGTAAIESQISDADMPFEMLLEVSGSGPEDLISQIRMIQQGAE